MIAITGANGQLGRLVITSLLEKTDAANIIALVRNPDSAAELKPLGIEVRQADYSKPETLINAFEGVDKLLLISGSEVGSRVQQHQAVIDAVKDIGLTLFAYTSILKADLSPMILAQEHKITEQAIKDAGLPAVILRNGWYSENYTQNIGGVLEVGMVAGAAEEGKLYTAARKDYADAAAMILTSEQSHVGKIYELAGDHGFTLEQYAAEISKQSGKYIQFQSMKGEDFSNLLVQLGLPEGFAGVLADAEIQAASGWLADDSKTLNQLIGRDTTPLVESIAAVL